MSDQQLPSEKSENLDEVEITPLSEDELDSVPGGTCTTGTTGTCSTTGTTGATASCFFEETS